jgi:hypothetical protein
VSADEQLQITREVIRRNELAFQSSMRTLDENTRVLRAVANHLEDLLDASRAHTRAIFALIDRLEGGGTSSA